MARRAYTDDEKAEALRLYETDGPRAASEQTNIPRSTIQSWAKTAGVRTGRSEKARAHVEAAQLDAKALRAQLEVRYLQEAHRMLDKMYQPAQTVSAGTVVFTDEPTAEALQKLMTTSSIALDKSMVARDADGDQGLTAATSVLERMIKALGMPDE